MDSNNNSSSNGGKSQAGGSSATRPIFRTEIVKEDNQPSMGEKKVYKAEEVEVAEDKADTVVSKDTSPLNPHVPNDVPINPLENIMEPPPLEVSTTQETVVKPPVQKKGNLPKKLFLFLGLAMVLGLLSFLAIKFLPGNVSPIPGIGEKGELEWWGLEEDEVAVRALIDEYHKKNPNVRITFNKQSPQDYRERLTNKLASGDGPDIYEIHNSWVPMFQNDLSPMPSEIYTQNEFSATFYPVIVNDLKKEKGILAMPLQYDAITLFVNENIFALAAKPYPVTWNDFISLSDPKNPNNLTIKERSGKIVQSAVALGLTENVDHWEEVLALMIIQNGVDLNKPNTPNTTATEQAIAFYKQFGAGFGNWDNTLNPSTTSFARGIVAMYFGPSYRANEIVQMNPNLKFKTVKLPQLVKNNPTDPDYSYATYWVQGVWERSANKDIAWDFLKFLTTRESLEKLNTNRSFAKIYPRIDMAALQINHPIFGSIVALAPQAKSWYLAGNTHDGKNGINTQIAELFKTVLDRPEASSVNTLSSGVVQTLAKYGVVVR